MFPFLIFLYYYILTCLFSAPVGYMIHNVVLLCNPNLFEYIYNYNKVIAMVLLIVIFVYSVWSTKYILTKIFFCNYKRFEVITDLKAISWNISCIFLSIQLILQILIVLLILHIYPSINFIFPLIVTSIMECLIFNMFWSKYIKIKKKDNIDPIESDVF